MLWNWQRQKTVAGEEYDDDREHEASGLHGGIVGIYCFDCGWMAKVRHQEAIEGRQCDHYHQLGNGLSWRKQKVKGLLAAEAIVIFNLIVCVN